MIDITLEGKQIKISFGRAFLDEDFDKKWWQFKDDTYGVFQVGETLGFNGVFKFLSEDETQILYGWEFPEPEKEDCGCVKYPPISGECLRCKGKQYLLQPETHDIRYILRTLYYLFNYEFEDRFPEPINLETQSFDLCSMIMGHVGRIYPPLLNFMKDCDDVTFKELQKYSVTELERINDYIWGYHSSLTLTLRRDYIFIQVSGNGVWLETDNSSRGGLRTFSFHNVDHTIDSFQLLIGLMAINTFFRKNQKT